MTATRLGPVLVAALFLTAGCLGGVPGDASPTADASPTPDTSPTPAASPTSDGTPISTAYASDQPDPNKEVRLENRWNRSVEIHLRVVRLATNETVHEQTYVVDAGESRVVYNLTEADPQGIESFRIVATARNTTKRITIKTNACYGNAYVEITEEGELYPYYAIC